MVVQSYPILGLRDLRKEQMVSDFSWETDWRSISFCVILKYLSKYWIVTGRRLVPNLVKNLKRIRCKYSVYYCRRYSPCQLNSCFDFWTQLMCAICRSVAEMMSYSMKCKQRFRYTDQIIRGTGLYKEIIH